MAVTFSTYYFALGEMAEWSIAAVLKTVDCYRSGGSNPSLSAQKTSKETFWGFLLHLCFTFISYRANKGFSENPLKRLLQHNEGFSQYTSQKTPWKIVCLLQFNNKKEALINEKKLKKYPTKSLIALINSNQNILKKFLLENG